jgi:hypothetical protein
MRRKCVHPFEAALLVLPQQLEFGPRPEHDIDRLDDGRRRPEALVEPFFRESCQPDAVSNISATPPRQA